MSASRPSVPATVRRELRKRAGYGCCRCGLPVYQYHHIIPWHIENHFRVEDMMILCPTCHDAATKGSLTEVQQRRLQTAPHNVEKGYTSGALLVGQRYVAVAFGGTLFVGDGSRISIDGVNLLKLTVSDEGELELSVELRDPSGNVLAVIDHNEWISGDPALWDMESDHDRLKIWSASRRIALDLDARATPVKLRADLWHHGQLIRLNGSGVSWDGEIIDGGGISNLGLVGMSLELKTATKGLSIVPYLGQGLIVSESDPVIRLIKSVNAWQDLKGSAGRGAFQI